MGDELAGKACKLFWADLEYHPAIDSLHLEPAVAAWKSRMQTKIRRVRLSDGTMSDVRSPRLTAPEDMARYRAMDGRRSRPLGLAGSTLPDH
jgi:hypothetical protein